MGKDELPVVYISVVAPEGRSFQTQYHLMFAFFLLFSLWAGVYYEMYWFGITAPLFVAWVLGWSVREDRRAARDEMLRELAE